MNNANEADITLIVGASGSGKSLRAKAALRVWLTDRKIPILIWDWKREYERDATGSLVELWRDLVANGHKPGVFTYWPTRDKAVESQFNAFCSIAMRHGNCGVLVEELSFVTKAGYSPAKWKEIITTGRAEGLRVMGTTQSPALVDKTMFTNATCICVGRLGATSHKKVMADALDMRVDDLRALDDLQWLVKRRADPVIRDDITLPGRKTRQKPNAKNVPPS